jgi:Zn-dependent protease with chaperone function
MVRFSHFMVGFIATLAAAVAQAAPLAYDPVGLGWSADEVERATAGQMDALAARAEQARQLGCTRHCERLAIVFTRLVDQARLQTVRSAALPWSLLVVGLPDIDAMAMPDGRLAISEPFVDLRLPSDEALAFVLAHEMAHSILEHERQALTFARLLLPRPSAHSVEDMYVEMDFNLSLIKAMEPVMQQGEHEADELGLLMASAAGFDPDRQLAFIEHECRTRADSVMLVATHPPVCRRLQALQSLLPLARRQRPTERG